MKLLLSLLFTIFINVAFAQKSHDFHLKSPDGKIDLKLANDDALKWSVTKSNQQIIAPSFMSMTLGNGMVLGEKVTIINYKETKVNDNFKTPFYKKNEVKNEYNQIEINFKGNFGLMLRAYNDGVAYRFYTSFKDSIIIKTEKAQFNFDKNYKAYIPYVRDLRENDKFSMAFEALYDHIPLSQFAKDTLAFLPILVDLDDGKKVAIMEADLEDYPGMFMNSNPTNKTGLEGVFANYPIKEKLGGFNEMNYMVKSRTDFMAKTSGKRIFPWRAIIISESDKELTNNDMVQKLASPSRLNDLSWIKPGKVVWDWWNDWNISHVDFKAGVNTETYKYYIDFAASNHLEYIVMDEGWSKVTDLLEISPKIDLQAIIQYGKEKNVGVILWTSWYAINKDLKQAFSAYSKMGIKGFKIDFIDRDDQKMVSSIYQIAKKAADYHLLVDFHGMYKPTGIQRTYPNVINFEGVKGLENVKWTPNDDMPKYDVTIPFIRMLAGPMDYTPGAMRNATKDGFRPSGSLPMSQGTRCHQMAMYVVFEAPLQMLADSPTAYMKEQESTDFIAKVPTIFDETVALDGKVGEYVTLARRKGQTWFIAGMTNWDSRKITLDLSFLKDGDYKAIIFKDGMNAEKNPTDYKKETSTITAHSQLTFDMASGGGFAIRLDLIN